MFHQLEDHAIPFACVWIFCAVLLIRRQIQNVFKAHFASNTRQYVNTESEKTLIARQIFPIVHHDIRYFLCSAAMNGVDSGTYGLLRSDFMRFIIIIVRRVELCMLWVSYVSARRAQ